MNGWVWLWRTTIRVIKATPWWGWLIIVLTVWCWLPLLIFFSPVIFVVACGAAIILTVVQKRPKPKKVRVAGNARGRVNYRSTR